MRVVEGDPDANLKRIREAVAIAAERGSDLLVLPEFWATGFCLSQIRNFASDVSQGMFLEMSDLSKNHKLAMLGTHPSLHQGRVFNTAVFFGKDGTLIGRYDKMHLFSPMEEERYVSPGSDVSVLDTVWGRVGLMVCFDLRFPELSRRLALDGAEIILVPAYWPAPRLEHWRLLLKARALENQVFVVGCNRSQEPGGEKFGFSAIVDPQGNIVAEAGTKEVLLTVDIDVGRVREIRERHPFFASRIPGNYGNF